MQKMHEKQFLYPISHAAKQDSNNKSIACTQHQSGNLYEESMFIRKKPTTFGCCFWLIFVLFRSTDF